ncbi:MAG: hypothetical protein IJU90_06785 [Bacteroidales bacterium]|nr:hypothetical protein [Bacteroidales bacterium]
MSTIEDILRRKERPLPKVGCSWAFYIFLVLMAVGVIISYLVYQQQA